MTDNKRQYCVENVEWEVTNDNKETLTNVYLRTAIESNNKKKKGTCH